MTLPTLNQKNNEKVMVSKLKKSYSIMQQAYLMAVRDKGTPDQWGLINDINTDQDVDDINDVNNFLYHMKDYLKITKYCGTKSEGCWVDTKGLHGRPAFDSESRKIYSKALLADGSQILTLVASPSCTAQYGQIKDVCGVYRIDVNGKQPPNTMGKDTFTFYITKTRIVPAGSQMEEGGSYSFTNSCKDAKTHEGRGCTAWVLYNENQDYLHCSDLSWDGKKTCKQIDLTEYSHCSVKNSQAVRDCNAVICYGYSGFICF